MKPRLLDLFCGAGGAGMGYARAGFEVVGVDIHRQPRYPFTFICADALEYVAKCGGCFDAIHASPPCQRYSEATRIVNRVNHPDLLSKVRNLLISSGKPWIIENVPGAPMRIDIKLCGCMFGLYEIARERWFETSWQAFNMMPDCHHPVPIINTMRSMHGPWFRQHGRVPTRNEIAAAMGIDWMRGDEIKQAIPPAYTEYIGRQLIDRI